MISCLLQDYRRREQRSTQSERNLYPAEIGPRHRRAQKALIDVWISQFAVGRHPRRTDARPYIESTTPFPIAFRLTCVVLAAKSGRNFSGPNMLSSSTTFALAGPDQEARHAIFGIETTVAVVVRARGRLHGCGNWIRFGDHRRDAGQSHVAERGLGLRHDECFTL
jgi:hypothetical protein